MNLSVERRLLQAVVVLASMVPVIAGGAGMVQGIDFIRGVAPPVPADLDSHFRYLSGLLCGIGFLFLGCVSAIEGRSRRFRLLGAIVIVGGLGRLISLAAIGVPGAAHMLALGMELGVVPLMMLWQWRLARRWQTHSGAHRS